jgi:hypothetical protein
MRAVLAADAAALVRERDRLEIHAAAANIDDAAKAAMVLHGADDVERRVHVVGDVEEGTDRQRRAIPRQTAVGRHAESAGRSRST